MATPDPTSFQQRRGTVLATFTQTGTYSAAMDMGGADIVACYSDNWPTAAGSLTFRASWSPDGTGYPVQTNDGTPLKVLAFGSGTYYSLGGWPYETHALQYTRVQIGTAGTAGAAGGGTIVFVFEPQQ